MTTRLPLSMLGSLAPSGSSDTAALQAALNTGRDVLLAPGLYYAANLTMSTAFQRLVGLGDVKLVKNANGPILTVSGNDSQLQNIQFRGESASPAFTGDNLVITGERPKLLNCGSQWAYARALRATGNNVTIDGSNGVWQTANTGSTGYDIEIGVSGTATLYHQLVGVYSSQATGGILMTDTGSHTILGGQFGKLTIAAGTSPAGVNGGMTLGARIIGAVSVGLASAVFAGNQFGAAGVTFLAGTSGCRLDASNIFSNGAVITNSGNVNNLIMREVSEGGSVKLKFGQDSSAIVLTFDPSTGAVDFPYNVQVPNNVGAYRLKNAAGSSYAYLGMSSGNNMALVNNDGPLQVVTKNGLVQIVGLPTSSAGLPSGALWRDAAAGNAVKVVA